MLRISIINGPNLNLLGTREPEIYGSRSFEDFFEELQNRFTDVDLHYVQRNGEGELIDALQNAMRSCDGIVFNGAGYTHTSIALADTIAAMNVPVIEVHISNIYAREAIRRHSFTASNCVGSITGLGLEGYALAVEYFRSALLPKAS